MPHRKIVRTLINWCVGKCNIKYLSKLFTFPASLLCGLKENNIKICNYGEKLFQCYIIGFYFLIVWPGGSKPLLEAEDLEDGKNKKNEAEGEGQPVSYSYTFFHLIFALASMYSAMLLSGWTSLNGSTDLIDVGWTSVWVRICTEWVTAALYIWSLIAPLLLTDREFF